MGLSILVTRKGFRWVFGLRINELRRKEDVERVHKTPKFDAGTRLVKGVLTYRYVHTGEALRENTLVEANARVASKEIPDGQNWNQLIYGDVRACFDIDEHGTGVIGWTMIDVPEDRWCWVQEPPLGATSGGPRPGLAYNRCYTLPRRETIKEENAMPKQQWTMERLETISNKLLILALIEERASDLRQYSKLTPRLRELVPWVEANVPGPLYDQPWNGLASVHNDLELFSKLSL